MNLTKTCGLGVALAAAACGDDGVTPTTSETDSTGTSSPQTNTSSPTTPTTEPDPTTDPPTTSETPTTDPETSTTTTTGDTTTTTDTDSATDTSTSTDTEATEETDTTGPAPICGDGNVDIGEECDDANQDETDLCTNGCLNAFCGDSLVLLGVEDCDDGNDIDTDACTATCALAVCGDAIVQEGVEACDDGNDIDDDECSNTCATAACGDGIVQMPAEQCDDMNLEDTDLCTSMCMNAKCGDGFIQEGVETCDEKMETATCDTDCTDAECGDKVINATALETCDEGGQTATCDADCTAVTCGDMVVNMAAGETCDDGNMVNTDACVMGCKQAKCGDGFVQAGVEECDDANMVDNDACSNTCKKPALQKIVFVTSTIYTGNLGGLLGADAKCQARAVAGGLPGTYMAWVSDDTGSPSTRMSKAAVPYVLPNGTKVANNWADLTDGTILTGINQTELLGPAPTIGFCGPNERPVWTNTNANGTQNSPNNSCANWTGGAGGSLWGFATRIDAGWTAWCSGGSCNSNSFMAPIYCVQQ